MLSLWQVVCQLDNLLCRDGLLGPQLELPLASPFIFIPPLISPTAGLL
jgi:hypothetical protein